MINVFKFIFDLLQATELNKQIILFCKNENQFKKIFQKKLNFLSLVSSKTIFVIIYKNNLKFRSKNIKVISINSEFSLRLLFSLINNCIVVTTTPTINKEISQKNKFLLTQHSLGLLENRFIKDNLNYFDFIGVNNDFQYQHLKRLKNEKNHSYRIIKEKYYDLDYIFLNNKPARTHELKIILFASSFYGNSIIKNIKKIDFKKITSKYKIIFRPHPESFKQNHHIQEIYEIKKEIKDEMFEISTNNVKEDILRSDYLVTDYSGIILSYFLMKKRNYLCLLEKEQDYEELEMNIPTEILKFGFFDFGYNDINDLNKLDNSIYKENNINAQKLVDSTFSDYLNDVKYLDLI